MRIKLLGTLDDIQEGMYVTVIDLKKSKTMMGYISDVKRSNKAKLIDGKPVRTNRTESVIIEFTGEANEKITLSDANFNEYQLTCRAK